MFTAQSPVGCSCTPRVTRRISLSARLTGRRPDCSGDIPARSPRRRCLPSAIEILRGFDSRRLHPSCPSTASLSCSGSCAMSVDRLGVALSCSMHEACSPDGSHAFRRWYGSTDSTHSRRRLCSAVCRDSEVPAVCADRGHERPPDQPTAGREGSGSDRAQAGAQQGRCVHCEAVRALHQRQGCRRQEERRGTGRRKRSHLHEHDGQTPLRQRERQADTHGAE